MASILPTSAEKQDRLGLLSQSVKRAFIAGSPTLHKIEKRISSCLSSEASQLTEISGYLLRLGGKRVRPLMTTMTSRLCGMSTATPALIDAAAGIELIHMATLLHDDIIDKSITRRSQPSAYSKYGLASTLLTGDFLLVKAFGLCARLDRFVIEATENACIELTEGEVLEGRITANRQIDFDDYVTIIKKKTASLFTLSTKIGAHLAGAPAEQIDLLARYGENAGIAFQMVDDVLDIVADEDLLGKPAGTDLKQKTPSLINILWLASGDPKAKEFFEKTEPTKDACQHALNHIKQTDIVNQARGYAKEYATRANRALSELENVDAKTRDQFFALTEYTLERCL